MKLSSYLDKNYIFVDLPCSSIEEAISEMVEKIAQDNKSVMSMKKEITKEVLKREKEMSTGLGSGIAIPHARLENFDDFIVAIATIKSPIKMVVAGSTKEDSVKLVVLIISNVLKNKNILKTMSAISKLAMKSPEVIEKIKISKDAKEIIHIIEESKVEIIHKIIADDILNADIKPIKIGSTLDEVAKRLILEKVSGLPVVDGNGTLVGEVTEKELIQYGMPKYTSLLDDLNFLTIGEPFEEYLLNEKTALVDEIYRKGVESVDREMPIMAICSLFIKKGTTRIYVTEKNKYVGTILRGDIIRKVLHL